MKEITTKITAEAIICLNGSISDKELFFLSNTKKIPIIAADGAINKLHSVKADYVIGDLDSISDKYFSPSFIRIENQYQYDFEKALDLVINSGHKKILILGINGGEYEHTLNNLSIFIKYSLHAELFCLTDGRIGFLVDSDIKFSYDINKIISIIPCPSAVITSTGLLYKLEQTKLSLGQKEGARNKTTNNEITLQLHSGKYMLFFDAFLS